MITFRWNPDYAPLVNGLAPAYIKMYYGGQLKTYTNSVIVPITNLVTTSYFGYDQYNCGFSSLSNSVKIPIYGLKLSNQIYTAYSFINSNGDESPLIKEAICGITITNKNDLVQSPRNLKIK